MLQVSEFEKMMTKFENGGFSSVTEVKVRLE